MGGDLISLLTIPLFSGAIGYATNWTGVWMLFYPVHFAGFKLPGLAKLAQIMPRRVQQVPGLMVGGVGWQGIIPSRAAKMGSIAVDKGIAKLGSPREFYDRLEPEKVAEHIVESSRDDIRELVERVMEREHPQLWRELTPELRAALHERVQQQFPQIVHDITDQIGENIDQLLDVKLMVIRHIEEHPELANKIFRSVGDKELKLIINFGFWFGLALGVPVALLTWLVGAPWVLLICGPIVGWVTNWLAILLIFEPVEARKIGPFLIHGMFLRRQREVADVYAEVIAEDVVNLRNMADELMHGARSDRTHQMIVSALRPAIDRSVGSLRPLVRLAVGPREYDAIRESVAVEGADYTMTPLGDPELNRSQGETLRRLFAERMRDMPAPDFSVLLRSAIKQDEWLLLAHGAVLGVIGGAIHLAVFA
jgi:uncharacterized membrane protein YheB (UPF0754 family)